MKGVINALKYVLSFSQESTKERPGTFRMVPGLSRRPKGLTVPLESPKHSCIYRWCGQKGFQGIQMRYIEKRGAKAPLF